MTGEAHRTVGDMKHVAALPRLQRVMPFSPKALAKPYAPGLADRWVLGTSPRMTPGVWGPRCQILGCHPRARREDPSIGMFDRLFDSEGIANSIAKVRRFVREIARGHHLSPL